LPKNTLHTALKAKLAGQREHYKKEAKTNGLAKVEDVHKSTSKSEARKQN
jgi:hypothetical protein